MFTSIVVGTDGSETAGEAVRRAIALALAVEARIALVSAYGPVPGGEGDSSSLLGEEVHVAEDLHWTVAARDETVATLEAAAGEIRAAGIEVEVFARQGDPADAILDVAEERGSDLIVVGNEGIAGAKRFRLGSVPTKVSRHAPCSVLIIRTG